MRIRSDPLKPKELDQCKIGVREENQAEAFIPALVLESLAPDPTSSGK